LIVALAPLQANARLGSGIVDLTPSNFDSFMKQNSKAMVDFVDGKEDQTSELKQGLRMIRDMGSTVPVARIDGSRHMDFTRRYFHNIGCSDETLECGDRFPQLLWFDHGEPTQYHRMLRKPENIASFVIAMDRDPIETLEDEVALENWNQVVLVRTERNSELYRAAEVVARRRMDSSAFVHLQSPRDEVAWALNGTIQDTHRGALDSDSIDTWLRTKLTVSEDAPEMLLEDGSVIVVGKTFEELVIRDDSDVMMIFYAPWCGFCRKTMPQWAKIAALLRDVPGAPVVAKMDGTKNRSPLPDFHWNSYPTIVYVRKGEKQPILFESADRTVDTFLEFAKNHSSSPIELATEALMLFQQTRPREL